MKFLSITVLFAILNITIGWLIGGKSIELPCKHSNAEFYNEFDIVYVYKEYDTWKVSTEIYGDLFVEMTYNEAIAMASVMSYVGYQCDYRCKDEMINTAFKEYSINE